jgi:hypothetical protein
MKVVCETEHIELLTVHYHRTTMRRVLTSFVLCVLAWWFLAPLALAVTADTTPACCRRNGMHHCMSGMSGMSTSTDPLPAFRSQATYCPYRSEMGVPGFVARLEASTDSVPHVPSGILIASIVSCAFDLRWLGPTSPRAPPCNSRIA